MWTPTAQVQDDIDPASRTQSVDARQESAGGRARVTTKPGKQRREAPRLRLKRLTKGRNTFVCELGVICLSACRQPHQAALRKRLRGRRKPPRLGVPHDDEASRQPFCTCLDRRQAPAQTPYAGRGIRDTVQKAHAELVHRLSALGRRSPTLLLSLEQREASPPPLPSRAALSIDCPPGVASRHSSPTRKDRANRPSPPGRESRSGGHGMARCPRAISRSDGAYGTRGAASTPWGCKPKPQKIPPMPTDSVGNAVMPREHNKISDIR